MATSNNTKKSTNTSQERTKKNEKLFSLKEAHEAATKEKEAKETVANDIDNNGVETEAIHEPTTKMIVEEKKETVEESKVSFIDTNDLYKK